MLSGKIQLIMRVPPSNGRELALKWKPHHGGALEVALLQFQVLTRVHTQFKVQMLVGRFMHRYCLKSVVLQTAQTLFG